VETPPKLSGRPPTLPALPGSPGYLKAVWLEIFGPVSPGFPAETDPRDSPRSPGPGPHTNFHETNQPRRPILRPNGGERQILPDCLQVPRPLKVSAKPLFCLVSSDSSDFCACLIRSRFAGYCRFLGSWSPREAVQCEGAICSCRLCWTTSQFASAATEGGAKPSPSQESSGWSPKPPATPRPLNHRFPTLRKTWQFKVSAKQLSHSVDSGSGYPMSVTSASLNMDQ